VGLRLRREILPAYRRINLDVWRRYRAGLLPASRLSQERFGRLARELAAPAAVARRLSRSYLAAFSRRGDLLPGSRGALRRLARDHALAIVTNGLDRVQRGRLAAARLEAFFPVVITSESCGYTKPDPRILHVALTALGVPAR
jgi:FMN phosphatase YigB (HAD superfamily)